MSVIVYSLAISMLLHARGVNLIRLATVLGVRILATVLPGVRILATVLRIIFLATVLLGVLFLATVLSGVFYNCTLELSARNSRLAR